MESAKRLGLLALAGAFMMVIALVAANPTSKALTAINSRPKPIKLPAAKSNYQTLNGEQFNALRESLSGKVVLINFWATWCGPCVMEVPHLEELYNKYKDRDFVLLAVTDDVESIKKLHAFEDAIQTNISYRVIQNPQRDIFEQFRIVSRPTTFVFDRRGNVRMQQPGYYEGLADDLDQLIGKLVEESV